MAHLTVMGPWVGPGEERVARHLETHLPANWEIVAGRKLPGSERADVDLIVVGENLIFVVEEKSWGPTVVVGDERWWVGQGQARSERRSPLNVTAHKARVLASMLRERIGTFRSHVYAQKVVRPVIVLSREDVAIMAMKQASPDELILALEECAGVMRNLDEKTPSDLRLARDSVITVIKDLGGRDGSVLRLGEYRVVTEQPNIGRIACFVAEHQGTGEEVHLRCFPLSGWGEGDPSEFFVRETRALARLADENRTWRIHPPFEDEERSWFVVPVIPPRDRRNLVESLLRQDPARVDGAIPIDLLRTVVTDAFRGLAAIHDQKLLHRILCPARIWLGQAMRVQFSDFYLAKIEGDSTVVYWAQEDEQSSLFRAPECRTSLVLATRASDVYALALSLAQWWLGDFERSAEETQLWLLEQGEIGALLLSCLADDPLVRPSASDVADSLQALADSDRAATMGREVLPLPIEFVSGARIEDRYVLKRKLGEGGSAISWLAYDEGRRRDVVVKQLRSLEIAVLARQEFESAAEIHHPRCARVWDILETPEPGALIHDFVEGESLRQRAQRGPLPTGSVRKIAVETLEILDELHGQERIHGDLSPGNIVINDDASPRLIDFGMMARVGDRPMGGTPATMAPEVLEGKGLTVRSDLYSLACTLIHVMLGRLPYVGTPEQGAQRDSTLRLLTDAEREQWGPEGTALLEALYRGVEPEADNRPATAQDFADIIRIARGVSTPPSSHLEDIVNPTVNDLRTQYRGSRIGNAGNRGLDDPFGQATYVPTRLDERLLPAVLEGEVDVVLLTGNPGDGKTAFLVTVREALIEAGGRALRDDESGWLIELRGRGFSAVYDASESHDGVGSDELVHAALAPADQGDHTALLAVNDGRLLQFFTDYQHLYPSLEREVRRRMNGNPASDSRVALVDLKQRAMADHSGNGLALRIAEQFTRPDLWEICSQCSAQESCPILRNAELLRGPAQAAIGELVLTSHLRRRRRATVRDVRSALAWIITGDLSCQEVHEATAAGLDLTFGGASLLQDLAFSPGSGDYLIAEWAELDPADAIAPTVERQIRAESRALGAKMEDRVAVESSLRRTFLASDEQTSALRRELRFYRYFEEYLRMLNAPDERARDRILLGISRIAGAPGFNESGLAVGEAAKNSAWAVLKRIASTEFSVDSLGGHDPYLESIPDRLQLLHHGSEDGEAVDLILNLDTAEIILRAADGELLGDAQSDALRQEIDAFAAKLRRQSADKALVVDPAGVSEEVLRRGGALERAIQ